MNFYYLVSGAFVGSTLAVLRSIDNLVVTGRTCRYEHQDLAVVAGTVTQTMGFQILSIPDYMSLKQSSGSGIEAAVIGARGLVWVVADSAAAVPPAIEPPVSPVEYEPGCSDEKHKCSNYASDTTGKCTASDSDCASDNEATKCPAAGSADQPECTDRSCAGVNEKCTTGDLQ